MKVRCRGENNMATRVHSQYEIWILLHGNFLMKFPFVVAFLTQKDKFRAW